MGIGVVSEHHMTVTAIDAAVGRPGRSGEDGEAMKLAHATGI